MSRSHLLKQQQEINRARRRLNPSPVNYGSVPYWFEARFREVFRSDEDRGELSVISELKAMGHRWVDHAGQTDYLGQPAFVAEPYGISEVSIGQIESLAVALGCDFLTNSNSWHYPGRTSRVLLFQREANR